MRTGLYPGTFDPVTLGHADVIRRAAKLVDHLVIGVAINRDKGPLFTLEERVAMLEAECKPIAAATGTRIEARPFENLLMHFAEEIGASMIVRGLRAVSDFEYEFQMALMNRNLSEDLETIFLVPSQETIYLSSRIIKEVARLDGNIDGLVPDEVKAALKTKFST